MNLEEEHKELQGLAPKVALCTRGYRTSIRSSTGATPYSLVYGMEAILPIETSVHSLKTVLESEILESDTISYAC